MRYDRYYGHMSREEADAKAIADLAEYIGERRMDLLISHASKSETSADIDMMNVAVAIAGVSGLPFHAFCRKHCLAAYRLWMADDKLGEPIQTDEEGYQV